ncbi:hypothetical protein KQX64_17675 [Rhodopseudomonas palustris]|nr:hypothetical protein KQX64_17675 [Rhodopseudomonas palustris]
MATTQTDRADGERSRAKPTGGDIPAYSAAAVDDAIAQSNRSGRRISKREGERIHALLRGWRE